MDVLSDVDRYLMEHGYMVPPSAEVKARAQVHASPSTIPVPVPASTSIEAIESKPQEIVDPEQKETICTSLSTMSFQMPPSVRVKTLVLDSAFRDPVTYPNPTEFMVQLSDSLRGVIAIRPIRTEFYVPSNTVAYMMFGSTRVGIQTYGNDAAYIYLNGWNGTAIANQKNVTNINFFGRITPGTEVYPGLAMNLDQDPHVYLFQPVEPRLDRFYVKLCHADGSLYTTSANDAQVILTYAVYYTGKM